jgi:hypothetical protein
MSFQTQLDLLVSETHKALSTGKYKPIRGVWVGDGTKCEVCALGALYIEAGNPPCDDGTVVFEYVEKEFGLNDDESDAFITGWDNYMASNPQGLKAGFSDNQRAAFDMGVALATEWKPITPE